MEFKKFYPKYMRMCKSYKNCEGCPRNGKGCLEFDMDMDAIGELENDVEKWTEEHPRRTRLQDFREKYPDALMKQGNCPKTCAKDLGYCKECPYVKGLICDCDECWNMPVEENDE